MTIQLFNDIIDSTIKHPEPNEKIIGYINAIDEKSISFTIGKEKFKATAFLTGFQFKLENPILSDNPPHIYLGGNLLLNKSKQTFKIIYIDKPMIDTEFNHCIIRRKNKYFKYSIEYYHHSIQFNANDFTPNGFRTNDKILFDELKSLTLDELIKLKNYLIDFDKKFVYDLYINKDFNRKYKIYYEDQFIEIE